MWRHKWGTPLRVFFAPSLIISILNYRKLQTYVYYGVAAVEFLFVNRQTETQLYRLHNFLKQLITTNGEYIIDIFQMGTGQ